MHSWQTEPSVRVLPHGALYNIALIPTIREEIIETQKKDVGMLKIKARLKNGEAMPFKEDSEGTLWFRNRIVVPKDHELRQKIMDKAHMSKYSIHPESNKMYHDLRKKF